MCVYPWSSYFLSFQTNHWSLWDTNKTSSKQLHLESKQHHLGTQIIKELYEMQSDGKSYLKLVHVPSLFSHVWLCESMDHSPPGSYVHGILQAIIQEWVAMLSLQGIFLTQGLNLCLLNCRWILYPLSHLESPKLVHSSTQFLSDVMMNCRAFFAAFKYCPLNQGLCCHYELCG